ncbi:MAG: PHP domain-containing protein [Anaerolineaceae bacterium]|nr:PHP domain-containing protein [Anaerolineaceae bacterium]
METIYDIVRLIEPKEQGLYLTVGFEMPEDSESLTLRYSYLRHDSGDPMRLGEPFTPHEEVNIVDLGLIDPFGKQVGASGSDKEEVFVSEAQATPGYRRVPLVPGRWEVLLGAYKVQPEGVKVSIEVRIVAKSRRLLKGDLHAHTLASDGVHTVAELAVKAQRHGLDFLAITDHNQFSVLDALPQIPGLTLIPGVEWTHYRGHANFLGVDQSYDEPFAANTDEEIRTRFMSAHERGALISVNHPFEEGCGFQLDFTQLPFDCLEVWNGPMRESNLRAVGLWQSLLVQGHKIPVYGGSDYHRDTPFIFLGGPTTCVYADSAGPSDILAALRRGHAFITFNPSGPTLEMSAGEAIMGDSVSWEEQKWLWLKVDGLAKGDVVRLVTGSGAENLLEAPAPGKFETEYEMPGPGFARVEVLRAFLPGIPRLPALISNPIYFE